MSPPLKRKRKASDRDANVEDRYPRFSDLYFDDGSIILVTQNTAFRVHKGLLTLHSKVFRDMFSVVIQPEDEESFDECPVVHLTDTRTDLGTLLNALYMVEEISFRESGGPQLECILRLGKKYMFDTLHRQALDVLRYIYPDTLSKWDELPDDVVQGRVDARFILEIAHDVQTKVLLPAAFYVFCGNRKSERDLLKLRKDVIITYTLGKDRVGSVWPRFVEEQLKSPTPPCEHGQCESAWTKFWQGQVSETLFQESSCDPLSLFNECSESLGQCDGICSKTKRITRELCDAQRARLWDDLPEIFELGSWEKFRKID